MKDKKIKNKKENNKFIKITRLFFIVSLVLLVLFAFMLIKTNMLPLKYLIIFLVVISILYFFMYLLLLRKKIKKYYKVLSMIFLTLFSVVFIIGTVYINNTLDFLKNVSTVGDKYDYYSVAVLNNKYKKLKELNNKSIGIFNLESSSSMSSALDELKGKIKFDSKEYDDIELMIEDFSSGNIDALFLNDFSLELIKEQYSDIYKEIKIIYNFSIKIKSKDISKDVDVTKTPFSVYIIGSDQYGDISKIANHDVNMVVTVNPLTKKILLTSIPRDYYVQLYGKTGLKDKLTHTGSYGIDVSVKTMETLLETDINYYAAVNFSTVEKIVDYIGGIDVNSDYNFSATSEITYETFNYVKGKNHLTGHAALMYARSRHQFQGGDRVRIYHQQQVLEAIINKASSSTSIISKYSKILASVEDNFETNMDFKNIKKLVKFELSEMPSWTIEMQSLDGSDASMPTYSFPGRNLYVMIPDEETVTSAINNINKVLNEK